MTEKKLWLPGDGRPERNGELSRDVRAAISCSFQRHLEELGQTISAFEFLGTRVLSPRSNWIVEADDQFVFLDSDEGRSIKGVQNRHLTAISRADLLYVICPDGYTGQSVCFEIGYATACGIPVLASAVPRDSTIKRYVDRVATPARALNWLEGQKKRPANGRGLILLEPVETIAVLHALLDDVGRELTSGYSQNGYERVERAVGTAACLLELPGYRPKVVVD